MIGSARPERAGRWAISVTAVLSLASCGYGEPTTEPGDAAAEPRRVVLTWSGDPATSQSVTWRTDRPVVRPVVEFTPAVPASNLVNSALRIDAATETVDLHLADLNQAALPRAWYHSADMTGLSPDTLYAYRVGDGGRWSEWYQFRTASSERMPFRFIFMGDVQDGILSHWARTIRAAVTSAPDARFVVYAGDLVNEGHRDHEWNEWFRAAGWVHATVNTVAATGNHEYRPLRRRDSANELALQWRPQFSLPTGMGIAAELDETVYWIEYQGVRLYVLNSNTELEAQAEWLRRELETSDTDWNIAVFHHPVFPSRDAVDRGVVRDAWLSVFVEHGIDLVLQGHDHNYARGHIAGEVSNEASTVLVTSVAGAKMYKFRPDRWDDYSDYGVVLDRTAENTQLFNVVSVSAEVLSFEAYTVTGELYDSFELRRAESGAVLLVENEINAATRTFHNTVPYEDRWTRRAQRNLSQ